MARAELFWPYVEKTLLEAFGERALNQVAPNVITIRSGSSLVVVRMLDADEPRLQVFCAVLQEVPKSPELLEKLNDLNAQLSFAKAFWIGDDVLFATELLAEGLEPESIRNAIAAIATSSDHFDDELKAAFGGRPSFPDQGDTPAPHYDGVGEGVGLPPGEEVGDVPMVAAQAQDDPEPEALSEGEEEPTQGYL